jgi:hypothetical protein
LPSGRQPARLVDKLSHLEETRVALIAAARGAIGTTREADCATGAVQHL